MINFSKLNTYHCTLRTHTLLVERLLAPTGITFVSRRGGGGGWGKKRKKILVHKIHKKKRDGDRQSVAEPHQFYAAPAPGENFDAVPAALAPAPTIPVLYSKAKFFKRTKF
jgi:hypothetical protein